VDLAMHPLFLGVANRLLTSTYSYYLGSEKKVVSSKPAISSTVGFRVNPIVENNKDFIVMILIFMQDHVIDR